MELDTVRDEVVLAALPHVAFDGWTTRMLRNAARDSGHDPATADRLFPGGPVAAIEHFNAYADRRMAGDLARQALPEMRLRERVALAVRLRLQPWNEDREAVRRAVALLALPGYAATGARITYRTVDAIWYAVGDSATDFSFYTKRATLAAVYSATVLYWLDDRSEGSADTWSFLERRLDDALRLPKLMGQFRNPLSLLPARLRMAGGRRRFGVRG